MKMDILSDTFSGTSLDGALWDSYGAVALAEGIVTLTDVAYTARYSGIKSLAPYDLTDSKLEAQLRRDLAGQHPDPDISHRIGRPGRQR